MMALLAHFENEFDFYSATSESQAFELENLASGIACGLGKQTPASYLELSYDSINVPASLVGAKESAMQKLRRKLDSYKSLKEGWDGYCAEPANRDSIVDARVFLSSLPENLPVPSPMLASDGEVSLFWETSDGYLEASFPGDGTYHYIFNAPGIRVGADDIPVTTPTIDQKFAAYLASI
ncbi:hypothetical protein [Pseudomonas sp. HN2-3]|jgi:hypothetical protein|uniref:hypothetical protein n=1 Tax=Pseudomonas sp. HN2-3 TaxID=2886360 RepID=UPI001D10B213|nr:hypothetical protein [Pseudomonas sp. HN2-3]UDU81223.1 hypothetical protein LJX93_26195 [Pseudomonas sp. HN2-3]